MTVIESQFMTGKFKFYLAFEFLKFTAMNEKNASAKWSFTAKRQTLQSNNVCKRSARARCLFKVTEVRF